MDAKNKKKECKEKKTYKSEDSLVVTYPPCAWPNLHLSSSRDAPIGEPALEKE